MNSNLQKAIADLKKLLFNEDGGAPAASGTPDLTPVMGKDGVQYFVDKAEPGGVMQSQNDAGDMAPVAAGDYELEDGTIVTVAEGGVIDSIKQPEEAKPEEMKAPETAQEFDEAAAAVASGTSDERLAKMAIVLQALVKNVFGWQIEEEKRRKEMEAALAVVREGFEKANEEKFKAIFAAIQEIAGLPAAESVKEKQKSAFGKDDKNARILKAFDALKETK